MASQPTNDNSGPVVFITGCTDGSIGHALAQAFLSRGCTVVATARSLDSMKGLEGEARVSPRQLDVRSEKSIREAVESVIKEFGRIDVLVNNAGVSLIAPLVEVPMDSLEMAFDTNVYGPMRLIQAVAPHMIEKREGKIVNVGSISTLAPGPWVGVFAASKAALQALNEPLRLELRSFGVSVMAVSPGFIASNLAKSNMQSYNKMPEWKYYKSFKSIIRERVTLSEDPRSTPADVFAKKVVAHVLQKNPPSWFSYGRFSTSLGIIYYLLLCVRDFFYGSRTMKCSIA